MHVAAQVAAPVESRTEVSVGVETRRDRLVYRFENPSTYEGDTLIPHAFEQRYTNDNRWAFVEVRYGGLVRWRTRVSITPGLDSTADDYDTFWLKSGDVAVEGTTGPARVQSFAISQDAALPLGGESRVHVGYRLRRDTADFGVGHKTIVRNGTIIRAFDTYDPEYTASTLQQLVVGLESSHRVRADWQVHLRGEVAPITLGRLLIQLPVKYPGTDLIFSARAVGGAAAVSLARTSGAWSVELQSSASRTWSPDQAGTVSLSSVGVGLAVGRRW